MWCNLLKVAWLVVVPTIVLYSLTRHYLHGLFIDTTPAAAAKIRPGMTLQEVEQVIGGPADDYRFRRHMEFKFVSGFCWPNYITWTTYQGRIDVRDGSTWLHHPQVPPLPDSMSPDGVVDDENGESVKWSPAPYDPGVLGEHTFAEYAAICYISALVLYCGFRYATSGPRSPSAA